MKCRLIGLTFAISMVPIVANAQVTIDMGKITCSQYLAMPQSQSDNFSAWMSGWFSYVLAVILIGAGSAPAAAQIKLDLNKITCGDWLGYAPADRDFVRYFMSGYYNAAANNNVLDYNRLQKNSEKVVAYCKKRKTDTLPTAIQKSAS